MYDRILYPTDGSDESKAPLENVRDLAETYGAVVHVLYVADTAHELFGLGGEHGDTSGSGMVHHPEKDDTGMAGGQANVEEVRSAVEEHGEQLVAETANLLGDVDVETAVKSGDPAQVIHSYADENDIDMIVMGTHGRTGLDRYLLGSVTEKVVRVADVPVLTVRSHESTSD
jgi:nucleotide-binding universal stress UspA family protein